jgi:host factor-I protein
MDINENNRLQCVFLHELAKSKTRVIIFLTNGVKLRGIILDFDHYSISMQWGDSYQLIYKNAISTISPWYEKIHGGWEDTNNKDVLQKRHNVPSLRR